MAHRPALGRGGWWERRAVPAGRPRLTARAAASARSRSLSVPRGPGLPCQDPPPAPGAAGLKNSQGDKGGQRGRGQCPRSPECWDAVGVDGDGGRGAEEGGLVWAASRAGGFALGPPRAPRPRLGQCLTGDAGRAASCGVRVGPRGADAEGPRPLQALLRQRAARGAATQLVAGQLLGRAAAGLVPVRLTTPPCPHRDRSRLSFHRFA